MVLKFPFKIFYLIISILIFNIFKDLFLNLLPFYTNLIILIFFSSLEGKKFNYFSLILSLTFFLLSIKFFSLNFYIPLFLIIFLWLEKFFEKNPKILFIMNLFFGFFLFFTIGSIKGISFPNFLISLHFSLPYSLIFINSSLLKEENKFPFGHFLPLLFSLAGFGFTIFRIYSLISFLVFFIIASVSLYSTLYQPPYKKPYPYLYHFLFFLISLINYVSLNL